MKYVIKTMDKQEFKITLEMYKSIINSKTDSITFKNGLTIKKSWIAMIYPEDLEDIRSEKRNQKTGRLYDGTIVKRHFGEWVLDRKVPDEKGNYDYVRPDRTYYPEITKDLVATEIEYQKLKELPKEMYYRTLFDNSNYKLGDKKNKDMESIGDILLGDNNLLN